MRKKLLVGISTVVNVWLNEKPIGRDATNLPDFFEPAPCNTRFSLALRLCGWIQRMLSHISENNNSGNSPAVLITFHSNAVLKVFDDPQKWLDFTEYSMPSIAENIWTWTLPANQAFYSPPCRERHLRLALPSILFFFNVTHNSNSPDQTYSFSTWKK